MATKTRSAPRSQATREDGTIIRENPIRIRQIEGRERTLEFAITTLAVNRYGEVDKPDGGRFDNYMRNPIVLFCHNSWDLPVARTVQLQPSPREVLAWATFAGMEQMHPFAETVYRLYRDGFLNAASIGFKPITISEDRILEGQTGVTILEWEMLEWSCVPVPANAEALKRFIRAYGLPDGATERDLMQATRLDPRRWYTIAKEIKPLAVRTDPGVLQQPRKRLVMDDGSSLQTLILSKESFPTKEDADAWITEHNYVIKEGAPDETDESWRYRQFPPGECMEGALDSGETFATIEIDPGVVGVLCKRAEEPSDEQSVPVQMKRITDSKARLAIMERMQTGAKTRRVHYVGRAECVGKVDRFFFQCAPPPGKTAASAISMTREDVRAIVEEMRRLDPDLLVQEPETRAAEGVKKRQVLDDENLEKLRTAHDLIGMVIASEEAEEPMTPADEANDEKDKKEGKGGDEGKGEVPPELKDQQEKAKVPDEKEEERALTHAEGVFKRLLAPATTRG